MISLLILLAATIGGAMATYLFDDRSRISYRLAAGACIGQAALGLVGFALAWMMGMTVVPVVLASSIVLVAPILALRTAPRRLWHDLREGVEHGRKGFVLGRPGFRLRLVLFVVAAVLLFPLLEGSMYLKDDGVFTSYVDYYADLTLHTGIITGFVHGENFPPEHPEYAGTRLAYPFMVDFVAAMLFVAQDRLQPGPVIRILHDVLFWQNFVLFLAMFVLFYVWSRRLTGSRRAAILVPVLIMLSGGVGFTMLFPELWGTKEGVWHYLTHLPHDYSAHENLYRWDNSFVYWFVPMRSMLLGVPLFLIVTGLWWRALGYEMAEVDPKTPAPAAKGEKADPEKGAPAKRRRLRAGTAKLEATTGASKAEHAPAPAATGFTPARIMLGSGAVAGLLPLMHAHTFATLGLMGLCLMLITRQWRLWILCAAIAGPVGGPQCLWALSGSAAQAEKFGGWNFGWSGHEKADTWVPAMMEKQKVAEVLVPRPKLRQVVWKVLYGLCIVWYWLINTGPFIPLLWIALRWKKGGRIVRRPLRLAYLPFLILFILPNVYKVAPWDWDNIKVLIYWYIPSVPLVALLLVRLGTWRRWGQPLAAMLVVVLTLSGGLDLWRVVTRALEWCDWDRDQVAVSDMIRRVTPPRAVILNAPVHNHPFILAGRRSFMGYAGTLWTHGIVYDDRAEALKRIYEGAPDAVDLLKQHRIDYVVVGPLEKENVKPMNPEFFEQHFPRAGEAAGTILYKVG